MTSEIESMEGEFKNMSHLIDYSTLTLRFSVPGVTEMVRTLPSLSKGFKDFGYALVKFLIGILFGLFYAVFFGGIILVLAAGFYWLTFGRIGIIRKLFRFLSGK